MKHFFTLLLILCFYDIAYSQKYSSSSYVNYSAKVIVSDSTYYFVPILSLNDSNVIQIKKNLRFGDKDSPYEIRYCIQKIIRGIPTNISSDVFYGTLFGVDYSSIRDFKVNDRLDLKFNLGLYIPLELGCKLPQSSAT